MGFLHLPSLPKKRCTCFVTHGQHDVVAALQPNGSYQYHCMYCEAPLDEMIASEEEYEVAWQKSEEQSAFLKGRVGVPGSWGRLLPWKS